MIFFKLVSINLQNILQVLVEGVSMKNTTKTYTLERMSRFLLDQFSKKKTWNFAFTIYKLKSSYEHSAIFLIEN
jgi:hypothetical protein